LARKERRALLPPLPQAECQLATVWVKRLDVAEGQYSAKKAVGLQQTVDDFKASWVADELLGVRPSLITLRLVSCAGDEPSKAEEEAAKVMPPRLTLTAAGVTNGCSLLASVAGTAVASSGKCGEAVRSLLYVAALQS